MKSSKSNSLTRLLSFVLIAVLLLCIVGFAAGGLQPNPSDDPDSGNVGDPSDKTDENTDGDITDTTKDPSDDEFNSPSDSTVPSIPEPEPKFYNTFTGLEVTEEISKATPLGFVLNPSLPLYGISMSDLSIEVPTEYGSTRLISFTTNSSALWKIGALSPTRAYISEFTNLFGGTVISYGNDDLVKYSAQDTQKSSVDISISSDCYYVENAQYVYSGKDMIETALSRNLLLEKMPYKAPPFIFPENGEKILGAIKSTNISLPYSSTNKTEFLYSESSDSYLMFKSGNRKVDMLNGKNISYSNIFILFANATTYEKAEGSELVMDITGGGRGYYASSGTISEIIWSIDDNGQLLFTSLSGEKLIVNKGNSYIGYYKASSSKDVTFS